MSWTLPSLARWGENTASVQFAVNATGMITNTDYAASTHGGARAVGSTPVITGIYETHKIHLPLIIRSV